MRLSLVPIAFIAAMSLIPMAASAAPQTLTPSQDPGRTKCAWPEQLLKLYGKPSEVTILNNGDARWVYPPRTGNSHFSPQFDITPEGFLGGALFGFPFGRVKPVPAQQPLPADEYHPGVKLLPYQPEMEALANGQ